MNKLIKTELNHIKNILLKYKPKIPISQMGKFEKDFNMIFEEADQTVDTDTLEELKRMAKGKLISMQRMYGALDDDEEVNKTKESIQENLKEKPNRKIFKNEG